MKRRGRILGALAAFAALALCGKALAQNYDFEWVTIGSPGNPAYSGTIAGRLEGRGAVPYQYCISRDEVTTSQWMEYVNTFSTQSDDLKFFGMPAHWGAQVDLAYSGPGRHWILRTDLPDTNRFPVAGISWREGAEFCNWLQNGKSANLESIKNGAYDTSTFGDGPGGTFTDQWTHNPDAKFWIPTLDEWIKAAHFDPNRYGPGQPGWWMYPNTSDDPPVPGLPGQGTTSGGYDGDAFTEWDIPLGAYPETRTPWGLLDMTGGTAEWTEEVAWPEEPLERANDGSSAGMSAYEARLTDSLERFSTSNPGFGSDIHIGIRIAAIPSPPSVLLLIFGLSLAQTRRRSSR